VGLRGVPAVQPRGRASLRASWARPGRGAGLGLTPYHAICRALPLPPGSGAVVIGVGGLGHVAVQLLRALTACRVIAVDRRPLALEAAAAAGAATTLLADGLAPDEVRRAAGGRGAGLVLDFVGVDATLALAAGAVAPGGHVSIVGVGGGSLPMRFGAVSAETPVVFSNWGRARSSPRSSRSRGRAPWRSRSSGSRSRTCRSPYGRLEAGGVAGRIVAVP
jgi:alcohol dehydrogenase, propanol-preferring